MLSLPIVAMFGILACAFETLLPFDVDSSVRLLEANFKFHGASLKVDNH